MCATSMIYSLILFICTPSKHAYILYVYSTYVRLNTVDPHLSEHLGTEGWSDMRNVQITETGLNAL